MGGGPYPRRPRESGVAEAHGAPGRVPEISLGGGDLSVADGRRSPVRLDPLEREGRARPEGEVTRGGTSCPDGRRPCPASRPGGQCLSFFRRVEPGGAPPWRVGPQGDG